MSRQMQRVRNDIEVGPHETISIETEFGTTLVTVVPHISGARRYTLQVEYVPYTLAGTRDLLDRRRN